jgi:nitrite reductase/ring-hydroxylating ferredoxin subunit
VSGDAVAPVLVCASDQVVEGGAGVRFDVQYYDGPTTAFVVRFDGTVRGYLNRCAHVPTELDWNPGEFFDSSGLYLICSVHGAHYEPETGFCVMGPCRGQNLVPVDVFEAEGAVWWRPSARVRQRGTPRS